MAIELASGARETCTVSGNDFTLTGPTSGSIDFLAAITKTATVVDGSTVYAYAFESADPSVYEVMEMTYNSASNKLVRVGTEHGSNGASPVTFDTTAGAVVIYRVLTEFDLTPRSYSILNKGRDLMAVATLTASAGLVVAGSATSYAQASGSKTITPTRSDSSLMVRWSASGMVARDGTSGAFAQARVSGAYINSGSSRAQIGAEKRAGLFNFAADTNLTAEFTVSGVYVLNNTNYNASNNWQFGINYFVSGAVMDLTITSFEFDYEEYID